MNYSRTQQYAVIILSIFFSFYCHGQVSPSLNYYELIDLDPAVLKTEALGRVQEDTKYNAALKKAKEAKDEATLKKAEDEKEKIRQTIENQFFASKIKEACQRTQEQLKQTIEELQKEVKEVDVFERPEKEKQLVDARRKLMMTTNACPILSNPAKRREYDQKLLQPGSIIADDYFQGIQQGIDEAMLAAPNKKVLVNDIIGNILSQIEIPGPAVKIFNQELAIRSISVLPRPLGPEIQYGIGFTGLMALNKFEVRLSIYVIQDIYGSRKFSFVVELPAQYKISDLFPTFKKLDEFKFPKAKFIISTFQGMDQEGFSFQKGFNFVAHIDLSGPLKLLNTLKDKASGLKSLVFESKPISLSGLIAPDLSQSQFNAKVPMYIGVDLRKIDAVPKSLSDVINQVTSDDFTLTIAPVKAKRALGEDEEGKKFTEPVKPYVEILKTTPPEVEMVTTAEGEEEFKYKAAGVKTVASIPLSFKIQAETGIRIILGTQKDPIRLNVIGTIIPISKDHPEGLLSVGGNMKGMLQFGWLAIGDAGLDFDFDGALMPVAALVGLPFTGVGIRGRLDLGKPGVARAILKLAGGFRVSASVVPVDLVFEASGENIRFADLISWGTDLATKAKLMKAPIPVSQIPTMTLHKVWGYCALKTTTIAGKQYNAGVGLQVETQLFDYKAGFRVFMNDKFRINGWGYLPYINFKVKGTEVFRLYGLTPDKGAQVSFNFDPQEPAKGSFGLQGTVHIPGLALKQKTNLQWRGYTIDADFETQIADFSVLFGLRMNTKAGVEMLSEYDELKREAERLISTAENSETAAAANKIMLEVKKLETAKRYEEARNLLDRIIALFTKIEPGMSVELPDQELLQIQGLPIAQYEQIKALLIDISQLFKTADTLFKQDEFQYQQALKYRNEAMEEYDALRRIPQDMIGEYETEVQSKGISLDPAIVTKLLERDAPKRMAPKLTQIFNKLNRAKRLLRDILPQAAIPATAEEARAVKTAPHAMLKKREVVTQPGAKWSKLYVKFGFKGDFAAFLNKHAVATLRKVKENATKKLDELNKKVAELQAQAVGGVETEIQKTRSKITAKEQEIGKLQSECSKLALYRQPKCRANIAAQQTLLLGQKGYLNTLLKPGKAVVKGVTGAAAAVTKQLTQSKALRAATEAVLGGAARGLELIAKGINFFNITEARGEYSWEDMQNFKLPKLVRLVAKIEIPEMPIDIVLENLQFDFKNPVQSATTIARDIMTAFIEGQQNKYLQSMGSLALP